MTDRTRLIAICNPNNPTGARLTEEEVTALCAIAGRHGAWVLSDEIYRGVERDSVETPTAWGRTERVIVTGGLSKAYGLPGLRIGWSVSTEGMASSLWSRRDYTTIAPGALSDLLARHALAPGRRAELLERARQLTAGNLRIVGDWLDAHGSELSWVPPEAGSMAFIRYSHDIGSTALATRLREAEESPDHSWRPLRSGPLPADRVGRSRRLAAGGAGPPRPGVSHAAVERPSNDSLLRETARRRRRRLQRRDRDLPGCFTEGDNLAEAVRNAEEAILCHLDGMIADGEAIPDPMHARAEFVVEPGALWWASTSTSKNWRPRTRPSG